MATLQSSRQAVANQISTVAGLRVSATYQQQVNPPQAIIMPQVGQIMTFETIGPYNAQGAINHNLRIVLLVSMGEDASAQNLLDSYLDTNAGNTTSVLSALAEDPTCGGQVSWAVPTAASGYGLMEWAGVQYFGTTILVTVAVL